MKKIILVLAAMAIIFSGCAKKVVEKTTLVVAQGAEPASMDPQGQNEQPGARVKKQIYSTLFDADPQMNIIGDLAEKWTFENDTTLLIDLKKNVKFHNGDILKASDVVYTLKRAVASPYVGSVLFSAIDPAKLQAIGDNQVRIHLKYAYAPILFNLAHPASGIVSEKATEADPKFVKAVGSGPFKFESWQVGDKITMTRFDDYYGEKPTYQTLVMRAIIEPSTRAIEVETGGIDIAYDIAPSDIGRVAANKDLNFIRSLNFSTAYVGFNCQKKPFNDIRVRQAINLALNMEQIVQAVYFGTGKPAVGPIGERVWSANPSLKPYPYDIAKAKALLTEAGYPNGFKTTLWTNDNQQRIELAQIVKNQLAQVGIEIDISIVEWATYLEETSAAKHDMFILGWTTVTGDPDYGLYATFHSVNFGSPGNRTFYKNPEVDALLDAGRTETDVEKRKQIYYDVQKIIYDEAPWIFAWQGEDLNATGKTISGFVNNPSGHHKLWPVKIAQ